MTEQHTTVITLPSEQSSTMPHRITKLPAAKRKGGKCNSTTIMMDTYTAPYLLTFLQPKACTKAIQTTITLHTHSHTHTCTHTHIHTRHHLRITCHQNTHTKRLKIKPLDLHLLCFSLFLSVCLSVCLSVSLSLPTRPHTGAGHMQFYWGKSRVSS